MSLAFDEKKSVASIVLAEQDFVLNVIIIIMAHRKYKVEN